MVDHRGCRERSLLLVTLLSTPQVHAFSFFSQLAPPPSSFSSSSLFQSSSEESSSEWTSDFDDFIGSSNIDDDEEDSLKISSIFKKRSTQDLTATQSRQFSLGPDIILSDYVGNMGFDEVTDWEYFYENEDDPTDRKIVQPNPLDASQPRRTRQKSGSVVRVFRGEFVGQVGGTISSKGYDRRVLVKEFTGDLALKLFQSEVQSIGKLQSNLFVDNEYVKSGDWLRAAAIRTSSNRDDNGNVSVLIDTLKKAPFLGILGEINLAELEGEWDPNEFYRALSVPPPKQGAVWVVYEYAGLNTIASYCIPPVVRRSRLPIKKGFFGNAIEPPELPSFQDRANYIVNGIMRGALEAVATLHESGIVHRSIGRSSIVLTSAGQDKREAVDLYFTRPAGLVVKLADFGFSGLIEESTYDEEFLRRARSFGFSFRKGDQSLNASNFAMAEDLHALGFVFLGLLLSTLAELPHPKSPMPSTDEDTLQRLLGEIFNKDIKQFREYVEDEEVWSKLVDLLDENDGAGWKVLETLFLAREKAVENKDSLQVITARGILSNKFFS